MRQPNARQRQALGMIERATDSGDIIWVTAHPSQMADGEAFIHYSTARALKRRGLIEIDGGVFDDPLEIFLVEGTSDE
ncbi:hypothetical protein LCGC14_2242940 [marine sediment metagenome]|uniref:Uncharacterized protein n=1 Tax=marine sediment metagenome TaxID=412755 RepID=A0A0F9FZU4_9ZZZZ